MLISKSENVDCLYTGKPFPLTLNTFPLVVPGGIVNVIVLSKQSILPFPPNIAS